MIAACGAIGNARAAQPAGMVAHPSLGWSNARIDAARSNAQTLTIQQTQPKAILNWSRFNIAPGEGVVFDQQAASWAALNRIHQADPSRIQGSISARGQVYLINQNGIVFANGAQVNVGGLVASTLDISDTLFNQGLLANRQPAQTPAFAAFPNGLPSGTVVVESGAELRSAREGRIMLIGSQVTNNGLIATPDGQTILAAGSKVYLAASNDAALRGLLVEVDNGGSVENLPLGRIVTERGNTTLVGLAVNQSGRVTATTTVNQNGSIRLLARDAVAEKDLGGGVRIPLGSRGGDLRFGAGSVTEVLPELADSQTIKDEQAFNRSSIEAAGRTIRLETNALLAAPSGSVSLTAQRGLDFQSPGTPADAGARIYLEQGSRIDVAGTADVYVPMERNLIEVELRGNELRDAPLQRDGALRGQTVRVDARKGTPLADVSGNIAQIGRDVGERTASGGDVTLRSEGDVILREGAVIDVSGGSVRYADGYVQTSKLLTRDGRVVDIGSAKPDQIYLGLADIFTVDYARWGMRETFSATRGAFEHGYLEGKNAGSITLLGHAVVLDGVLRARAQPGERQRQAGEVPLGGTLTLGDASAAAASLRAFKLPEVDFVGVARRLQPDFGFSASDAPGSPLAPLPEPFQAAVQVPVALLRNGGFSRVAVFSDGRIRLDDGVRLDLVPGSARNAAGSIATASLALTGREIELGGTVSLAGGNVSLTTVQPLGSFLPADAYAIRLGERAAIRVAGMWINDLPETGAAAGRGSVLIAGGVVSLTSASDVLLAAGSVIDVSGGASLDAKGKLQAGAAGSIRLKSGRVNLTEFDRQRSSLVLDGELLGYGIGRGGTLTLDTSRVTIGAAAADGVLALAPGFFQRGGFTAYSINGQDGLEVAAGTHITPRAETRMLAPAYRTAASGADIDSFTQLALLPAELRPPTSLTLSASSTGFGDLLIGRGAAITLEPRAQLSLAAGNQLTLLGALTAPAGTITLTTADPVDPGLGGPRDFGPSQSIWLGAESHIAARGLAQVYTDGRGLRQGEVLDAGTVTIDARTGYVVAQPGSVIDASAVAAELDIVRVAGERPLPTTVAASAGSIAISAQEGLLLGGTLRAAPAAPWSQGGSLTLALNPAVPGNPSYPTTTRVMLVSNDAVADFPVLAPGQVIDPNARTDPANARFSHKALIAPAMLNGGGFDSITLRSPNRIEFKGEVAVTARRSLAFQALTIAGQPGAQAQVDAAYVSFSNTTGFAAPVPAPGDARLHVGAGLIDFEGDLALSGFERARFASDGDIRFKGSYFPGGAATLAGELTIAGALSLDAAQIYPTTLSRFVVEAVGAAGSIEVSTAGGAATPVLSAGGELTLKAPVIHQAGVIKAPAGRIVLDAADALTLATGSLTSVSADGLSIPFGRTELSGRAYVYGLDTSNNIVIAAPPEKRVDLRAAAVRVEAGASIDLSGGGDLYAYEFVPGPGGSRDVLDAANSPATFAILPGSALPFAPYDHHIHAAGTQPALAVGDAVYLAGADGVPAGTYTLLPARYALLPGAYLVTAVAGTQDFPAGAQVGRNDGAQLVSGHSTWTARDGTQVTNGRSSGFLVRPGTAALAESEFLQTSVSTAFPAAAGVQSLGDAGAAAIRASALLDLRGDIRTRREPGAAGAQLDIAAPKLAVASEDAHGIAADFVRLDPDALSRLDVASIVLGATRSAEGERTRLSVISSEILVANDASSPLRAPEVILAASQRLDVRAGASIRGEGDYAAPTRDLIVGGSGVSGDGALIRVAAGPELGIVRENASRTTGILQIEQGAQVGAQGAVLLDASRDNFMRGTIALQAGGALALGAGRIALGETALVDAGLVLGSEQIAALGAASSLTLRSYSTVDTYGSFTLGSPALQRLTIEAGGINGYRGSTPSAPELRWIADTVVLSNPQGSPYSAAPVLTDGSLPQAGGGSLHVQAEHIVLGPGRTEAGAVVGVQLKGYETVALTGRASVTAQGSGAFEVDADLTIATARLAVDTRARQAITATGLLEVAPGTAAIESVPIPTSLGGRLDLSGRAITVSSLIEAPAGRISLAAVGPTSSDSVILRDGARISAAGASMSFDGLAVHAPGGSVSIASARGDIVVENGALLDVSGSAGGTAGGLLLSAAQGSVRLDGGLKGGTQAAAGVLAPAQGTFVLDVASLADFSAVNTALEARYDAAGMLVAGGFTGWRDIRVRNGDVIIGSEDRVVAREVVIAADDGNIEVHGTIDASGDKGGRILLAANEATAGSGSIRVTGSLDARALLAPDSSGGTAGRGGQVELAIGSTAPGSAGGSATAARIVLEAGAVIDVSGAGSGAGGSLILRAPRLGAGGGDAVAIERIDAQVHGASETVVEAYKVYNATTISASGATTDGGVFNVSTTGAAANTLGFREANEFIANKAAILDALGRSGDPSFHLRPGLEIRSSADLTLNVNETAPQLHLRGWDLSTWRFDGEPGVLTLRAAGDLRLNSSLGDGFTATANQVMQDWITLRADASWSYRLVAGADLDAASPLAVVQGVGDFALAAQKLVRTGSGAIDVAAGRDLVLADAAAVIYTAGIPGAAIPGYTPPVFNDESNRPLRQVNPVSGGDIRIAAGRDVKAVAGSQLISDWLMQRAAQRTAAGTITAANPQTTWWPRFQTFQQGVGTLAGGDVSVLAGRNIENLAVVAPTNGVLGGAASAAPDAANLVVRGGGDLLVRAGEDLKGGVFLVMQGSGRIEAGGNILTGTREAMTESHQVGPVLFLGDGRFDVLAGGDLTFGAVLDPTLLPQAHAIGFSLVARNRNAFTSYAPDAAVHLTAVSGDVRLLNDTTALTLSAPQVYGPGVIGDTFGATLYPGTLRAAAMRGDLDVMGPFTLFPSARGDLDLLAGGSVSIAGSVKMSDLDPAVLPSVFSPSSGFFGSGFAGQGRYDAGTAVHSNPPLHSGDAVPVRIVAGSGDISFTNNAQLIVPEPARIIAGRDIRDPDFGGQNLRTTDATVLAAGRDIVSTSPVGASGVPGTNDRSIQIGGPGRLEVIAGRDIDLGTSVGIVTRGALDNPFLPEAGASIFALAGAAAAPDYAAFVARYLDPPDAAARRYGRELTAYMRALTGQLGLTEADALAVFRTLPVEQQAPFVRLAFYEELKQTGRDVTAAGLTGIEHYARGYDAIAALFPAAGAHGTASGDINLFFSQIKTEQGGVVELMAPAGLINAGLANQGRFSKEASRLGVMTLAGGSIRAFAHGDFLVNQSRVFTLAGGDILIWSSEGNIDAGRGSKTASATPPPQFRIDANGVFSLDITQSIAGSGIGVLIGRPGVVAGDVDLIAPKGEVNAGDAGIRAAGNLNIAAVRVVGADNIQVGGRATGVPVADTSGLGGALAAVGSSAAEATRAADQVAARAASAAQSSQLPQQGFKTYLLTIEVLGFGD